jgi:hypothetical protein
MRSGMIPQHHQAMFVANRTMEIRSMEGIDDIDAVRAAVLVWAGSEAPEIAEDVEPAEIAPVEALKRSEIADPAMAQLIERMEATTAAMETFSSRIEEADSRATRSDTAIRVIAGIVGFELEKLDTERGLDDLAAFIQGEVVRAGAVLSMRNKNALAQAATLIREVLESADKPADETPDEAPAVSMAAPTVDLTPLEDQLRQLTEQIEIINGERAADSIVAGEPVVPSFLDTILARLPKETN